MTCRELIDFLMDYTDGNLPAAQQAMFEKHLTMCPQCVEFIDTYNKTIEATRAACAETDELPDDVPEELIRAILDSRKK